MIHSTRVVAIATLSVTVNLAGCIYAYEPIDVLVLDAEYDTPIPNAQVNVSYSRHELMLNAPKSATGLTDKDGRLTIKVAKEYPFVSWSVDAPGYLPDPGSGRHGPHRIPLDWLHTDDASTDDRKNAVVRLFREPDPKIIIIVPDGYRGPFGIRMNYLEAFASNVPGKREYVFTASEAGFVEVDAIRILRRINPFTKFEPRYASGEQIPLSFDRFGSGKKGSLALRFVDFVPIGVVYAVGDWDDFVAVRQVMSEYSYDDPRYAQFDVDDWQTLFEK